MLDTVQREPLTIEKHGRAVAVVMSAPEYQHMKPERLRAKLAIGEGQLDRGKGKTVKVFLPDCLRKHETLQAFGQLLSNLHRALQLDKYGR
jgi:hypothetical protein